MSHSDLRKPLRAGGVLSDGQITSRIRHEQMITPGVLAPTRFNTNGDRVISYGVTSYGYDARLAPKFRIFTNVNNSIVDPKNFDQSVYVEKEGEMCIIPPNSFILGSTVEYFKIPRDLMVFCIGKSTYARCGLIVNVTPLEPEWEGTVTIEISNSTQLPAVVYANEGICQFVFLEASQVCDRSYADKGGKYQGQTEITLPKL